MVAGLVRRWPPADDCERTPTHRNSVRGCLSYFFFAAFLAAGFFATFFFAAGFLATAFFAAGFFAAAFLLVAFFFAVAM